MQGSIQIDQTTIQFTVSHHARAKRVSMTIRQGKLKVTVPAKVPLLVGKAFVAANHTWIKKNLKHIKAMDKPASISPSNVPVLKVRTRNMVRERLEHFNKFYGYDFNRITIRDQSTRWGSCSSNKTLSFNYRLVLLPPELADYVVVHELCHLKEMNHSSKFWQLVAKTIPDYPIRRKQLRKHEQELL